MVKFACAEEVVEMVLERKYLLDASGCDGSGMIEEAGDAADGCRC